MAIREGFPVRPAQTDADDVRLALAGVVVRNQDRSIRAGILGGPTPWVMINVRSSMAVGVAAFVAVTSRSTGDGVVLIANDGEQQVSLTTAPASNSRIDVVWVKQNDSTQGDANATPTIGVTAGTAASVPTKPTIPVGALELGTILVPANVTGTNAAGVVITHTHLYTAAAGGVVQVRNSTEQNAFPAADGQVIHRLDSGLYYGRVAGAWVALGDQTQARQYGLGRTVPNGTTVYSLSNTGESTSMRTTPFFNVTYNGTTAAWTLATAGWYLVSATVSINIAGGGSNGGTGAQLRVISGGTDLGMSGYDNQRTTTVTFPVYSDGSLSFVIEGAHNSGAQRDMTGTLRLVRLGGLG